MESWAECLVCDVSLSQVYLFCSSSVRVLSDYPTYCPRVRRPSACASVCVFRGASRLQCSREYCCAGPPWRLSRPPVKKGRPTEGTFRRQSRPRSNPDSRPGISGTCVRSLATLKRLPLDLAAAPETLRRPQPNDLRVIGPEFGSFSVATVADGWRRPKDRPGGGTGHLFDVGDLNERVWGFRVGTVACTDTFQVEGCAANFDALIWFKNYGLPLCCCLYLDIQFKLLHIANYRP